MPPFIILSLPRSRSAWLSKFLTYSEWTCEHEALRHVGTLEDAQAWLSIPRCGFAEPSAAPWWRLISKFAPEARIVVVRRPWQEVLESFAKVPLRSAWTLDLAALAERLKRLDAKLDQAAARLSNVLQIRYADLNDEITCARVFEHCLPYPHDSEWWRVLSATNIQVDLDVLWRQYAAFAKRTERLREAARAVILVDMLDAKRCKQRNVCPTG